MDGLKSYIALLCAALLLAAPARGFAPQQTGAPEQTGAREQQTGAPDRQPMSEQPGVVAKVTAPYRATPVPTCGTWKLRQLVHHTGAIHRWVEAIVSRSKNQSDDM